MSTDSKDVRTAGYLGLPQVPKEEFNRIAKQIEGGACWVNDETNPGTPDPTEIALCNAKQGVLDDYVELQMGERGNTTPVALTKGFNLFYRNAVEKLRQELIQKQVARTVLIDIPIDLNKYQLNADQKKMAVAILKAGRVMDELFQAQQGVSPDYVQQGTLADWEFLKKYQTLWCEDKNPLCVADSRFPKQTTPLYPEGITCAEMQGDLTNPFSIVAEEKNAKGERHLESVPYAISSLSPLQWKASKALKEAAIMARAAKEASLADYMDAVAEAVLSSKTFPYVKSDEKWITSKNSRFFLRIGADEYNEDTICQSKAQYHMTFAIKDPKAEENLSRAMRHKQDMEVYLASLIPGYQPRKIQLEPPEPMDVVMESGDSKGGFIGTSAAQTLPNWCGEDGKAECKTRIMLFSNKTKLSYNPELFAAFKEIFTSEIYSNINVDAVMDTIVYHEVSHNLGPQMKNYVAKLGNMLGRLEELKAETGSVALQPKLEELGLAKKEGRKGLYTGLLAWSLGHIRRGASLGEKYSETKSAYQQLAAVIVGHFTEQGAFTYKNGQWDIVWDKAPEAAKTLYARVGQAYLKGDRTAIEAFFKQYTSGDGLKYLHLDRLNETIVKVPFPLFHFTVTGFEEAGVIVGVN